MKTTIIQSMKARFALGACAAISLFALSGRAPAAADPASSADHRTIRWVVPHPKDDDCFRGLLEEFAHRIDQKSGGALKVEFIDSEANSGRLGIQPDKIAYDQIMNGEADISQLSVGRLGVRVIDMPFLFRSYEHAEAVWRGPAGSKLLEQVATGSQGKLRGFAFAYSGGYRMLVGEAAIRKVSDLSGLKMRDTGGSSDLFGGLGVKFVKLDDADLAKTVPVALPATGKIDLEEVEINELAYLRQKYPEVAKKLKYVNLTRHSMLVTSLVVNEKFFSSLTPAQQTLLSEEMSGLGAPERLLAVDFAKRNLARMTKEGVALVNLPAAEKQKFAKAAESVYAKAPELAGLVAEIRAVKEISLAVKASGGPAKKGAPSAANP